GLEILHNGLDAFFLDDIYDPALKLGIVYVPLQSCCHVGSDKQDAVQWAGERSRLRVVQLLLCLLHGTEIAPTRSMESAVVCFSEDRMRPGRRLDVALGFIPFLLMIR